MAYEDVTFFEILAQEMALRDMDDPPITPENYDEVMERMGVYLNEYGDSYALQKQLEVPLSDLSAEVLENIHLGVAFHSMQEIEAWLETLES